MKKSTLFIAALVAGMTMSAQVLINNGPFVSHPGQGPGGADASALDTATHSTYGFGHQLANFNRVADDFTIPANTYWFIDSLIVYGYQTGSSTTSTMTHIDFFIWDANLGTGTVLYGDTASNLFDGSTFSNCYRTRTFDLATANTRPIMRTVHKFSPQLMLGPGTYWVDWRCGGTLASGPWANPVTIPSQVNMGNAQQKIGAGAFAALADAKLNSTVALPFQLKGTVSAAGIDENSVVLNMNVWPNPVTEVANVGILLANGANLTDYSFSLVDVLGKEVYNVANLTSGNLQINCTEFPAGVYMYRLTDANGTVKSGKINVVK
ncbi:MAG: T9SS type A sorting domain-containing protein [Bacteroidia bacterium]|nr:T9SS type A sorting domain-containing protein [Bacteroidia bacterium]